jgi:hypothetical protein
MKQHWLGRFTLAVAALGLLGALAPAPAAAVAQLAAPAHLQVAHIDEDSADLWWTRDTRALQEVIEFRIGDEWRTIGWDNSGFRSLTRLDRGQTYTLRMYSVPTSGSNLMRSGYSEPVTFTTLPAPDSVPPTKTSAPGFREVTTTYVDINWVPTGDNVEVTGYYLQQLVGGDFVTVRTLPSERPFTRITGLRPGTSYTFAVIAFGTRLHHDPGHHRRRDVRGDDSARWQPFLEQLRQVDQHHACRDHRLGSPVHAAGQHVGRHTGRRRSEPQRRPRDDHAARARGRHPAGRVARCEHRHRRQRRRGCTEQLHAGRCTLHRVVAAGSRATHAVRRVWPRARGRQRRHHRRPRHLRPRLRRHQRTRPPVRRPV